MKQPEFKDFIATFPAAFNKRLCSRIIDAHTELNKLQETVPGRVNGRSGQPEILKAAKNSTDVELGAYHSYRDLLYEVNNEMQVCYDAYQTQYWQINEYLARHSITAWQIQHYDHRDRGGYHYFHIENSGVSNMRRVMAYIVYLNDIDVGGETEFLNQAVRVQPRVGTVCIFPAYFTHVHRGNPVLSAQDKYILTGWFEYV